MNRKILLLFFALPLLFLGCSTDQTTVQILRSPLLEFDAGPANTWKASNYSISRTSQVVVYPGDTTLPAQLYDRYSLQGSGKDQQGHTYQLVITFDVSPGKPLVGLYSTTYTSDRGLAQVQLFDLTDKGSLAVYNLCLDDLQNDVFQVAKQKEDEKIITGSFQMTMCNSRDSTRKLTISNGTVKDLTY